MGNHGMKWFYFIVIILSVWCSSGSSQEFVGPRGFLTLEAEISNRDSVARRGTFDLHHFNLFGNYLLTPRARVFGEIEWEHGTDTERNEPGGEEKGIVRIERAWFEYRFSHLAILRLGKFLTPYGIYNEIHDAAPAYDSSILPVSVYGLHLNPFGSQQRLYPKFSLGLLFSGNVESGNYQLLYKFFLSNGRGKNPYEQDDNKNKGVGLRVQLVLPWPDLKLGYSFTTDKNGLVFNTRQTSHLWDIQYEYKNWRLRGEIASSHLEGIGSAIPEFTPLGIWGEIAFLLFGRQTILCRYDYFDATRTASNDLERDIMIGTSIQLIKQLVVWKGEIHYWTVDQGPRRNYVLAISSLAVTF
ncbi:MAG: hypothetical protein D6748_07040 [Calditrichaeota bacterium]|nr:MAG: hypothetical protein D6748_07040 [Calditrichota bacterium]